MSARELAGLIRRRKLSARELMEACLEQINRVNPRINAIVARLDDEECHALAAGADRRIARREVLKPLHGLPTAFKDTEAALGFPYTRGSSVYKDFMPPEDTVVVERLRGDHRSAHWRHQRPMVSVSSGDGSRQLGVARLLLRVALPSWSTGFDSRTVLS
jgi:hypothetical protein